MKRVYVGYVIALLFAVRLVGCTGSGPGPNTWIDQPLDGSHVSMEKQTVLAHAASMQGIDHVEFVANDVFLGSASGGGARFAEIRLEWLPTAAGQYAIRAVAVDAKGHIGPQAVSHVIVDGATITPSPVSSAPGTVITPTPAPLVRSTATPTSARFVQPTATPTPASFVQPTATSTPKPLVQPTLLPTPTPTPAAPTLTPTPRPMPLVPTATPMPIPPLPSSTPPAPSDVRFWVGQDTVQAGECTTVYWHVSHVRAYWVDGTPGAGDDGSMRICPCDDETHSLRVIKADGSEQNLSVRVRVEGECAAPPPPPPGDSDGPTIGNVWLEPRGTSDTGCRVLVHVRVSDRSGVGWVRFHWAIDGDGWNTIDLNHSGGNDYESLIPGVTGGNGTIEFRVEAGDSRGNISQSGMSQQSLPFCGPG